VWRNRPHCDLCGPHRGRYLRRCHAGCDHAPGDILAECVEGWRCVSCDLEPTGPTRD
jgi:hypothetical protein